MDVGNLFQGQTLERLMMLEFAKTNDAKRVCNGFAMLSLYELLCSQTKMQVMLIGYEGNFIKQST